MKYIPYSRQDINEQDIEEVAQVLRSDYVTQGPAVESFENAVKNYTGAAHAIAVSNGTTALHLALIALGVVRDDIVWTSPISFVASANCALYIGAEVDFVDVATDTGNIDIDALYEKLKKADEENKLPKALVVVHFAGRVCDMKAIEGLSKRYGFKVVEDSAHALGAEYEDGKYVGHSHYSDCTTYSFHPVKAIATGEGGMVTTSDDELAERLRLLRSHGITRDEKLMKNPSEGPWYYEQIELGMNYRICDIQCALGASQMTRLRDFIHARRKHAERYDNLLKNLPIDLPPTDSRSAWHIYVIQLHDKSKRREVFEKLRGAGIGVNVHYIPIHTQPYYIGLGFNKGDFPFAEHYYEGAISIPLFPGLKESEQDYIVEKLTEFLG